MSIAISGIHHVTAISGSPQGTVDFYAGVLGLRLVKRTVNFDDPGTYHLYFGDDTGKPGTLVTFFPWGEASRGRGGTGQVNVISLSIPQASLGWWLERLIARGVPHEGPVKRFGEQVITLRDQDGIALELVAHPRAGEREAWSYDGSTVPAEHAIRGLHAITMWVDTVAPTAAMLVTTMGFRVGGSEGATHRFVTGSGGPGAIVDVRETHGFPRGVMGIGTVHHIAWRVPGDDAELASRAELSAAGAHVTPVRDRQYFHSIYFHEPGGVLFEIATDVPGFLIDEPKATLGTALKLPPWLESARTTIEPVLPPLHAP
jgi:catechol 2,3-dioxygenase-like lactoylglutathione lyase family enzyme